MLKVAKIPLISCSFEQPRSTSESLRKCTSKLNWDEPFDPDINSKFEGMEVVCSGWVLFYYLK